MSRIFARRTVVEVRFKPQLSFYQQRENIGQAVINALDLSDWRRESNRLELYSVSKRQSMSLEYAAFRIVSDALEAESNGSAKQGFDALKVALNAYDVREFLRVGIRQWFAMEIAGKKEKALVAMLNKRFANASSLEQLVNMKFEDLAFVYELECPSDSRKSTRIEFGAMDKEQWHIRVPLKNQLVPHCVKDTVNKIIDSLPNDFIFVDVDRHITSVQATLLPLQFAEDFVSLSDSTTNEIPKHILKEVQLP